MRLPSSPATVAAALFAAAFATLACAYDGSGKRDLTASASCRTASGIDINRDHVKFDLPETAVVHRAMNAYQPQVVVDCREFSVYDRWLQKWGVINAYDMTLIYATNPNVPAELTRYADVTYKSAIVAALDAAGYKHGWYYTTSYREADKRVQMGGLAPDISRNTFGLQGSISFLLETRGVGIGRDHFLRRVHTHVVALEAVLRTTAANPDRVMRTVAAIRDAIARAAPAASSFVTIGVIPVDKVGTVEGAPSEVPIYRLASPTALALAAGEP